MVLSFLSKLLNPIFVPIATYSSKQTKQKCEQHHNCRYSRLLFVCGSLVIEEYEMEDVFLNDDHSHLTFNNHDQWDSVGDEDVSFLPLNDNPENEVDVLAIQMDITSSLSILKTTLGHQLGTDISHCEIWLQDTIQVLSLFVGTNFLIIY